MTHVKARPGGTARTDPEVAALIAKLPPPLRQEVEAVRRIILGANREIREGVKWNAPSFRTADYFATLNNPRAKKGVLLVLHTGAKKKGIRLQGKIADPAGLLEWLGEDRCLVRFADRREIAARQAALKAVIRQWVELL